MKLAAIALAVLAARAATAAPCAKSPRQVLETAAGNVGDPNSAVRIALTRAP